MIENIISLLKDAYKRNWITPRDGNISYKSHGSSNFLITPSGLRKQDLKESDFIELEINNDGWKQLNNFHLKPSGEIELHYELLKCVKNDICVVHLHPTNIIAAMYRGIDLSSLSLDFPELSRYTKIAKNTEIVPPLSKNLALQCKSNLIFDNNKNEFHNNIVGIPNHGIVSIGKDVYDAFEHVERLEHIASIILLSAK
jgi:ribulose-5-phosphate 4-epimerase/fuculose-1-phosphate aldolase